MTMERKYYDTNTEMYITESELRDEFENLQLENPGDYERLNFNEFVFNCMWQNGGTLEEVMF